MDINILANAILMFTVFLLGQCIVNCHKLSCLQQESQDGIWIDTPPYWKALNCTTLYFDKNATKSCFSGRTIYAIGSSISRQILFAIIELLGADTISRVDQKKICPKHASTWGEACHQTYENVTVKFLFLQFFDGFNYSTRGGFPYTNDKIMSFRFDTPAPLVNSAREEKFSVADNCIHTNISYCLNEFLNNSKENDILILSLGLSYTLRENPSIFLDIDTWLRESAIAFRKNLYNSNFKGTIFRLTMSPIANGYYVKFNPIIVRYNKLLWTLWGSSNNFTKHWYTIDQHSINADRKHLYNDHVHFAGNLTHATIYQIMTTMCPLLGHNVEYLWHANKL